MITTNSSPPSRHTRPTSLRSSATLIRRWPTSMSNSSPVEWPSVSFTSLKPSRSNSTIDVGRLRAVAGKQPPQLLLQRKSIGQAGQLVVMGEPPQLLFRLQAVGDVLVGPGDVPHRAVGVVHRRRGEPDVDPGAVLAQPLELHVADRLAVEGALEQRLRLRLALGRHENERAAEHLLGGVAEHPLGAAVPEHDAPLAAGADDRDRRCVDHGRERILGSLHLVGGGAGLVLRVVRALAPSG